MYKKQLQKLIKQLNKGMASRDSAALPTIVERVIKQLQQAEVNCLFDDPPNDTKGTKEWAKTFEKNRSKYGQDYEYCLARLITAPSERLENIREKVRWSLNFAIFNQTTPPEF